jgi:MarR family transcriptional regulator, organic hydroperoxide resistance regulator
MPKNSLSQFETPKESPGFLLWQVTNLWQRELRAVLKPLGLTHVQFVLLAATAWHTRNKEVLTQAQLANHAKIDVMMTSQVVRSLEEKKWIAREAHPTDTRALCVTVTPEGRELAQRAFAIVEAADQKFFATLGESQKLFTGHLQKLLGD